MRSLRLLSFGNCSSAWTQQINVSSLCLRLALTQQQQQPSVCATGGSRKGLGVLLLELKAFGQPDASVRAFVHPVFRDSFSNESSDFLRAGCLCTDGCTLSLGLGGRRRYHTSVIVGGKKGKKAEKDILVNEREDGVDQGKECSEDEERTNRKKKLRGKKDHDQLEYGDVTVENGRTEVQLKSKKKKLEELSQNGDVSLRKVNEDEDNLLIQNQKPEGTEDVVNGALRVDDPRVEDKQEVKKKLRSKVKDKEDLNHEGTAVEDDDIGTKHKDKRKLMSKQKPQYVEEDNAEKVDNVVVEANLDDLADGETFQEFEDTEQFTNVIENELVEELGEHLEDDDIWEDDFDLEPEVGDGGEGGGVVLGDSSWGQTVLDLANDTLAEFNGDLAIFAFKVSKESELIHVRLDKLSDKYGSPTIDEIQQFSSSYSKSLEQSGEAGIIPKNLALEVSSPGAERVVQIPQDLERFKELPMYVRYLGTGTGEQAEEKDGVLELESVDTEGGSSVWKIANVRINRELVGKGRGLNKKQREWRVQMPFESLQLVRLYIDL
ncbi:unnamed protein product [Sphagnum balticum]